MMNLLNGQEISQFACHKLPFPLKSKMNFMRTRIYGEKSLVAIATRLSFVPISQL